MNNKTILAIGAIVLIVLAVKNQDKIKQMILSKTAKGSAKKAAEDFKSSLDVSRKPQEPAYETGPSSGSKENKDSKDNSDDGVTDIFEATGVEENPVISVNILDWKNHDTSKL